MTAACIGWPADPPCPVHGMFHGCIHPEGHQSRAHVCACGQRANASRSQRKNAAQCGTQSGYQRHRRLGETPCDACLQALRDRDRARRAARAAT